ncbi:hypothetical protein I553_5216 [Mycobacterium xenopi 4042]|uniref:Uncharacterized protein n=1 Tax=Mycobacterium xenopi 4042 TaxID=1299334 RepID=X7ZYQ4_MYCXE|nr:hypothetical protein I553_5216 [Mycobacterium xenopi 4042]
MPVPSAPRTAAATIWPNSRRLYGSAARPAPGDLGHRAAEVHIDVVGQVLVGDHLHGLVGGGRVDGVELQRPGDSSGENVVMCMVAGWRSTSARAVTISQT